MYLENGWPVAGLEWPRPKPTRSLILGQVSQGLFSWREGPERAGGSRENGSVRDLLRLRLRSDKTPLPP